jgi:hypothetical protein
MVKPESKMTETEKKGQKQKQNGGRRKKKMADTERK